MTQEAKKMLIVNKGIILSHQYKDLYYQKKELEMRLDLIKKFLKGIGETSYPNGVEVVSRTRKRLDWDKLKAEIDLEPYYKGVDELMIVVKEPEVIDDLGI